MLLKEIMQKNVVTVAPDCTIREAAKKMKDFRVGYLLVTNSASIKGCVTDRDIVMWLAEGKNPEETRIGSVMQANVVTVSPETDVFEASKIMAKNRIRRLPVVEDSRIAGIVSTADIASVLEEEVDNFLHVEEFYQL